VRKSKALVVGNPVDGNVQVGPIVNTRQAANVERIVAETITKGAGRRLSQRTVPVLFLTRRFAPELVGREFCLGRARLLSRYK
jgi:acyl-CoA reductase-like NAD-dependent aldehyde dehydrogenase